MPQRATAISLLAIALSAACGPLEAQTAGGAAGTAPPAPAQDLEALRTQGRHAEALGILEARLAADPEDTRAYRQRALTLADLGSSALASEAVAPRPDLFPTHERERIEGDRVARMIGWGGHAPQDARQPLAEARTADAALHALQATPRTTRWEATRLRVDALSSLSRLQQYQAVVDGYDALLAEGIEVPAYILPTVGDALLALRRPEDAEPILQAAIAHDPAAFNARLLLGYAWLEQERFDLATPHFEALAASQDPWPRRAGARSGYENWDRYSADVNLAMVRSFGNDNDRAEASLGTLGILAPRNASLQSAIGGVQSRRMRPTAALERYDMALTLEPGLRDAHAGRVDALMTLDRMDDAEAAYQGMRTRFPDDTRLDRIGRALERRRGWQASVEASRAKSDSRDAGTSASPLGSRDGGVRVALATPLIDDRWRIGAIAEDAWADFDDQRVRYRRAGLGVQYRYDRLGVSAFAFRANDDYDDGDTALTLAADWRFSDAWRGTVAYARRDVDASLQARRFGITADSLAAAAVWTPSEETWLRVGGARYRYEDGNSRDALSADGSQRLFASPHWLVDGLAGVSTSRGSDGDQTPYFNPERDASASVGLRIDQMAWRRYERHFRQRLELTAGPYWQRDYGTHWVPTVGYRHLWQASVGHTLEYGVSWSRPVYDGNREQRIAFDLAWRWGDAP